MTSCRLMSLNLRGAQESGGFARLIHTFCQWKRTHGIAALCAQEHNLNPQRHNELTRLATLKGLTLVIGYAPAAADGNHWGGTLILVANDTLDYKSTHHKSEHAVVVDVEWGGTKLQIASVYAPVRPLERVNFFLTLPNVLTADTIVGGDWNCVVDVTTDVKSSNPLAYRNVGAQLLAEKMGRLGLLDERGDQLDGDSEITRAGTTANGHVGTRLDRWYVPTTDRHDQTLWTFELTNAFLFKREASDHSAVILTVDTQRGELGHDRRTVREDLLLDRSIQQQVLVLLNEAYKGNRSNANKWIDAMTKIKDYLMHETALRRRADSKEIKQRTAMLKIIQTRLKKHGPTARLMDQQKRIQKELYHLKFPEVKELPTDERAYSMQQSSDVCSRQQFLPYKQQAKRAWVNEVKVADWVEGREPNFTSTTTNTKACANEFAKYYRMLFERKDTDPACEQILLRTLRRKRILPASRRALDARITDEEVAEVMENLPLGKQPGPNRIPNAVYRYLSRHFAPKLAEVLNEMVDTDRLPKHFLEGDISVLYKKKARDDPRNYRPITLLNTDYKIFTRILAQRMKKVVHEFVSESQKGFVPHAFIAEATTLLNLVEAYINDKPLDRKGILLMLDMEKAFDRVSYSFTKKGLAALGFGDPNTPQPPGSGPPRFSKWVSMMYNEDKAPRRRIYVNGYYSEWFSIKSGVAQGCPLSPLLFLVVAEALRASFTLEPQLKGIEIGGIRYLLSQFADDTTLLLRSKKEIKYVNRAIRRWCKATGMRENTTKREGIKMGKYRHMNIPEPGITWAGEGEYVTNLGVPIGNDLDAEKWWSQKVVATRNKTAHWAGLYRSSYFGRNLIVQGMYFGRLRYWLYSLPMTASMISVVQKDADILWWSREPHVDVAPGPNGEAVKNSKRIRRWVRAGTTIGPRRKGGLNTMDWKTHQSSFLAQWVLRYVKPGEGSWKTLLDHFLLHDRKGNELYPEGRSVVVGRLSGYEKQAMITRLPKKATYIRKCLRTFWGLKMEPVYEEQWEGIEADLLWHSHRCQISAEPQIRKYCKRVMRMLTFANLIDVQTNRLFSIRDWQDFVEDIEEERTGVKPTNHFIFTKADAIQQVVDKIPAEVIQAVRKNLRTVPPLDECEYAYLTKEGKQDIPVRIQTGRLERIWIDDLAVGHPTGRYRQQGTWRLEPAAMWIEGEKWEPRWAGIRADSFPCNSKWKLGREEHTLAQMSIKILTKARVHAKAQPPPSQLEWEKRIGAVDWSKVWGIRSFFCTPRDEVTWLKVHHRNLYVANRDPSIADPTCNARGCTQEESMLHLAECRIIRLYFWNKVIDLMRRMGLRAANSVTFLIVGRIAPRKYVDKEEAGIMFIAWRCLYAEVVAARVEGRNLKLDKAYARTVRLVVSRLKANGTKWYRWYSKTRNISIHKVKLFPEKYRKRKLITTTATAEFTINSTLLAEFDKVKTNI